MGSIANLSVRGVDAFTWRNSVDPTFLFLYTASEVVREPRPPEDVDDYQDDHATVLVSTAGALADRLDFLGIGASATEAAFQRNLEESLASTISLREHVESEFVQPEIDLLTGLQLSSWVGLVEAALDDPELVDQSRWDDPRSLAALLEIWRDDDPRLLFRALLMALNAEEDVRLDISDLLAGGWIEEPFDPQAAAIDHFSYAMTNGTPAVVITEGSTDARFLQAALDIRYPHLVSYIRFLDFGDGAEGSAAAGVRTLKSFAAAGISNRVILLLDNDSAARDALRSLKTQLPTHYVAIHYPRLALAEQYPTLGPTGISVMDVNGLAASVEMYLGADVLTDDDGKLTPVQWRSYLEGVKAYQGELMHKKRIQERFLQKVEDAKRAGSTASSHDWSGVDAIIDTLRRALTGDLGGSTQNS
jgi:hypothetical protein